VLTLYVINQRGSICSQLIRGQASSAATSGHAPLQGAKRGRAMRRASAISRSCVQRLFR